MGIEGSLPGDAAANLGTRSAVPLLSLYVFRTYIKNRVNLILEQATKAQRGSRGMALLLL